MLPNSVNVSNSVSTPIQDLNEPLCQLDVTNYEIIDESKAWIISNSMIQCPIVYWSMYYVTWCSDNFNKIIFVGGGLLNDSFRKRGKFIEPDLRLNLKNFKTSEQKKIIDKEKMGDYKPLT